MAISAQEVQKLRGKTGAGLMDCKKALEESTGDIEKAIQILREKGKASAAQKSLRSATCGVVCSWISADLRCGSLVEINCETDFVARTSDFLDLAKSLARITAEKSLLSAESLLTQNYQESKEIVESAIKEKIGLLGENIVVSKAISMGNSSTVVGNYIHAPMENAPECGSLGVLAGVEGNSDNPGLGQLLREISMQIAASSPKWVKKEDVPAGVIEQETKIYKEQCRQSGKPEKAWEKITQGKLADFHKQFCLLEQPYIRDPKLSMKSYIENAIGKGQQIPTVQSFYRFKVGEE